MNAPYEGPDQVATAATAVTPPTTSAPTRTNDGAKRGLLTGAVAGALVGALVASGTFVLLDDDGLTTPPGQVAVTRSSETLDGASDIAAIIAKAQPAIVAITTGDGPGSGSGGAGTGFVISDDGFIVTNNHVVEGATEIEVSFTNGEQESARIVGRDPSTDLAVLKVDATGLPTVELGDSDAIQVGDEVVAIGNALALEGGLSVTRGIISGVNRTIPEENGASLLGVIQTDAAINPGNSGGPLLDVHGRVIGINTAIANPGVAQNVGFAIPISRAKPTIDDLQAGRKPAFLGVATQTVDEAVARELDLKVTEGAYVANVTDDSPAQAAGIRQGDVIVKIGDDDIKGSDEVQAAVRSHRPDDTVEVVVNRDGEIQTFRAKLTERPDAG